ncbi:acyl-CoA thioesterase [Gordonia liuliyuniae]|uniref:Acyl-CoA thioesterase n=1 Tax=Gordonia liuliyuniae TaxID=2911517 RepID=A0ABS9IQB1_9ACTN|nr:acyl-CoA thioesterase [Gordonia liuliyuniae]MCF8587750.1 acyl-CoA thioesterase [Gordonia liuliyuniae]
MSDEENMNAPQTPFAVEVALRWGDQDSLGHINNVQIARVVEEARIRAMNTWFGGGKGTFWAVLARQEIEFVSILHYDPKPVQVQVWITRIGTSSFDFGCRVLAPTGEVAALTETTLAALDPKAGATVPLPDAAVRGLREHVGDPVPFRRRR